MLLTFPSYCTIFGFEFAFLMKWHLKPQALQKPPWKALVEKYLSHRSETIFATGVKDFVKMYFLCMVSAAGLNSIESWYLCLAEGYVISPSVSAKNWSTQHMLVVPKPQPKICSWTFLTIHLPVLSPVVCFPSASFVLILLACPHSLFWPTILFLPSLAQLSLLLLIAALLLSYCTKSIPKHNRAAGLYLTCMKVTYAFCLVDFLSFVATRKASF